MSSIEAMKAARDYLRGCTIHPQKLADDLNAAIKAAQPSEKMAKTLDCVSCNLDGEYRDDIPEDASSLIRRLAAALIEFHAVYKAGGWAKDGIEERHAEALRDVRREE